MEIHYYTTRAAAFGGDDTAGIDVDASLDRLADQIRVALQTAYPQASITVGNGERLGLNSSVTTDSGDDALEMAASQIAEDVWRNFDWVVYEGGVL